MIKNTFFEIHLNKNQTYIKTWFKFLTTFDPSTEYFHRCRLCRDMLEVLVHNITTYDYMTHFGLNFGDYSTVQFQEDFVKHICFEAELICIDCKDVLNKKNNFGYECWAIQRNEEQLTKIRKERAFC